MMYRLSHATIYEYAGTVSLSHHLLRLRPRDLPRQRCLQHELSIDPRPQALAEHVDYYGNAVEFVTLEGSHRTLSISARSHVEVTAPDAIAPGETPAWETATDFSLEIPGEELLHAHEFVYASPLIRKENEFADYARESFPAGRPLLEAVLDLTARMHKDFKFDPKATNVATPLREVFKLRRGVCQDFAQLEIGFLRAMGLAARYVSGYLETEPPPGKPRLAGADASHAWVSFYCPGVGWIDVDPTNNLLVGDRHITLAWGRDYSDISPVRGIIVGSGEHTLEVAVDVIPISESSSFDSALLSRRPEHSALRKP
jgi:transglutaminase-like putative cysteine protease